MELSEKGYLSEKDVGMKLSFGDVLAEGSYRLAKKYGHPELSMSVKKQELPAYDPRGAQGLGLEYATSNRGGCHVRGYMIAPEILGVPEKLDPLATEGKAGWTKTFQDLTSVVDSCNICLFTTFALGADDFAAMLSAATGFDYTTEELMKAGERIWNLERLYNIKAGFTRDDDTLPERLLKEKMPEGAAKGHVWEKDALLDDYYKVRGWDKNGVPTKDKVRELGL